MTSHKDVFEGRSADELDKLIRWALRERVVGASPSSHVWERIKERVGRPTAWRLMGLRFSKGYRAVMAQLARVGAFLSAQIVSWMWPQNTWVEWRHNPCFTRLSDQYSYSFLLQLAF